MEGYILQWTDIAKEKTPGTGKQQTEDNGRH